MAKSVLKTEDFIYQSSNNAIKAFGIFNEFRKNCEYCDATITVAGLHSYRVHRLVLIGTIPYFRNICDSKCYKASNSEITLDAKLVDPTSLETILDFVYSSNLVVKKETVISLFKTASFLLFEEVMNVCEEFMRKHLSLETVFEYMTLAENFDLPSLISDSNLYISSYLPHLSVQDIPNEFVLTKLIRWMQSHLCGEEVTLCMVFSWITSDAEKRVQCLFPILQLIRLDVLASECLNDLLQNPLLRQSKQSYAFVRGVLDARQEKFFPPPQKVPPNHEELYQNALKKGQYPCAGCGASFSQIARLEVHLRVHTRERPYKCTFCEKSFTQLSHLWQHTRRHTKEKPYKCFTCGSTFTQVGNLQHHAWDRHKEELRSRGGTSTRARKEPVCDGIVIGEFVKSDGSRKLVTLRVSDGKSVPRGKRGRTLFSCSSCEFQTLVRFRFEEHLLKHSGKKECECEKCGLCFRTKSMLRVHILGVHLKWKRKKQRRSIS